jgi:hypothetical protein
LIVDRDAKLAAQHVHQLIGGLGKRLSYAPAAGLYVNDHRHQLAAEVTRRKLVADVGVAEVELGAFAARMIGLGWCAPFRNANMGTSRAVAMRWRETSEGEDRLFSTWLRKLAVRFVRAPSWRRL